MKKNSIIFGVIVLLSVLLIIQIGFENNFDSITNTENDLSNKYSPLTQGPLDTPTLNTISPSIDTDGQISLSWNTVFGASYYNIYRNTSIMISINSSLLVGTTTKLSLIDYVNNNGTYYYGVTAENKTDGESPISENKEVTVSIPPQTSTTHSLEFSRVIGGEKNEISNGIAVDDIGNSYVTGNTQTNNFFVCNGYDDTLASSSYDAFIAKYSPTGAKLWETYLGGNAVDEGESIAIDNEGNNYIVGTTSSSDFPLLNANDSVLNGENDIFLTKFNSDGVIQWSTYFGGDGTDKGYDIAIDESNYIYITGLVNSTYTCIAKFNSTGYLIWKTTYGGAQNNMKNRIAIDYEGHGYIIGYTSSSDFPIVNNTEASLHGNLDVTIVKFNTTGSIIWSTLIGGAENDYGLDIVVDLNNNCYFTGYTHSPNFPTKNAYNNSIYQGTDDGFVTVLNSEGELLWSTFLGGIYADGCFAIAVDSQSNCYVSGISNSNDFPIKNSIYSSNKGYYDLFLTRFNAMGQLILSSYIGGTFYDYINGICVDQFGNTYIVGETISNDFPIINVADSVNTEHDVYYDNGWYYYVDAFILCYPHIELLPAPNLTPITPSESTTGEIWLDWNDIGNATNYVVYRSSLNFTKIDASVVTIKTTTTSSAYDEVPDTGEYYYAVAVYDKFGYYNLSYCQKVTVTGILVRAPTLHPIISPVQIYNSIHLTWNNSHRATSYNIYRSSTPFTTIENAEYVGTSNSTEFYYKSLTIGSYYYGVTTRYSTYGESTVSNNQLVVIQYSNNTIPILTKLSPDIQLFFVGENFTLKWKGTDPNTYRSNFTLFCNQTQISEGNWTSGIEIKIFIIGSDVGRYIYDLYISDGYYGTASAQVSIVISLATNDEDGDGMTNGYERKWQLNPFANDSAEDPDTDQLVNYQEFLHNTNPFSNDSDGEGLADWDEIFTYKTDPNENDTDHDNFSDLTEIQFFTNPLSYWSNPVSNIIYVLLVAGIALFTARVGKRHYKKQFPRFKQKYREILEPGYIFNLPKHLRSNKIQFFRLHFEHQLKIEGYRKKPKSQDWFSKTVLTELQEIQIQLDQKNFISVAREMTKMKRELLENFEIPKNFLNVIKNTVEQEISMLEFSTLDVDLLTIIKGFDLSYKQKTPLQSGKNLPIVPNEFQIFLTWREEIIPLQQILAYNHQIKKEIDQEIDHFKKGEWIEALSTLNEIQQKIESKKPPYANSVHNFIKIIYQKCTDFLNTIQNDQLEYLHTLQQQEKYDMAVYSWLKFTQFKHPEPKDPQWQSELTVLLKAWKKQIEHSSSSEFDLISRNVQWIMNAFSSQADYIAKIGELNNYMNNMKVKNQIF